MSVNPIDHPELYESFILAGERSPGVCKFPAGLARDNGWELQQPKGSAGGETVHNGQRLLAFDVELYIWRDDVADHYARWVAWRPILRRPIEKGASKALDIYHPVLDELGVTSVVVAKEGALVPDGKGGGTVKISLLEYSPPKPKAAGKPAGSTSAAKGAPTDADGKKKKDPLDPNKDLKDELDALVDQLKTPGGGT